jgi:hypothetical protein
MTAAMPRKGDFSGYESEKQAPEIDNRDLCA